MMPACAVLSTCARRARTDLRHALRALTRSPVLSLVVIATLALAIAANATIFSLLKPTVLRKLPVAEPDSLVRIGATDVRTGNYSAIHLAVFRAARRAALVLVLGAFQLVVVRDRVRRPGVRYRGRRRHARILRRARRRARVPAASCAPADDPLSRSASSARRLDARLFGDEHPDRQAHRRRRACASRSSASLADGFTGVRMDGGDDLFVTLPFLRTTLVPAIRRRRRARSSWSAGWRPASRSSSARAEMLGRWPAIQASVRRWLPAGARRRRSTTSASRSIRSRAAFPACAIGTADSLTLVMGAGRWRCWRSACVNLSGLMLARASDAAARVRGPHRDGRQPGRLDAADADRRRAALAGRRS